jgi:hypothetical protein
MVRPLLILVLAMAAMPGAASAQRVAGPTASGAELRARDGDFGGLCIALGEGASAPQGCGDPFSARLPVIATGRGVAGAAVASPVARVEVEWADGARTGTDTGEGAAYQGAYAGRVRFALLEHAGVDAWMVRLYDASGAVLGAVEAGNGPVVGIPVTVATGRVSRLGAWRAEAVFIRRLAAAPGEPDRTEARACLRIRTPEGTDQGACEEGEPRLRRALEGGFVTLRSRHVGRVPRRDLLAAVVGPAVASIEAILGDGHAIHLPVRTVAGPDGRSERFIAWTVPEDSSVRGLVVRDGEGREIEHEVAGIPPASVPAFAVSPSFRPAAPVPTPEIAAGSADGSLRIGEAGARLCVSVDAAPAPACGLMPVRSANSLVVRGKAGGDALVGGAVPLEVTEVAIHVGGRRADVIAQAQAPAPYAGRFAEAVHVFLAHVQDGHTISVQMRSAGRDVDQSLEVDPPARAHEPARLLTRIGGARLMTHSSADGCFTLRDPVARSTLNACSFTGSPQVLVPCRPALIIVTTGPHDRVVTAAGRHVTGRRVTLAGRHFRIAAITPPDAPRALIRAGLRRHLTLGPVPPASRQCGYEFSP